MRYLAAYMLGSLGGKEPSASDIEKILSSVGIESNSEQLTKVLSQLKGKRMDDLISEGKTKLASMPSGGGAVAATAAAAPAAAAPEAKKEEKKPAKEESDVSDDDMGFGLFD